MTLRVVVFPEPVPPEMMMLRRPRTQASRKSRTGGLKVPRAPATLLLAPNGTRTLATAFWAYSSEIDYAGAAPYALLMVLLSLPMTWLLYIQSKKTAGS